MPITSLPINVTPGKDCYAYANSGNHSTPTWTETDNIQEVKIENSVTQYELKLRANRPFPTNVPTMQPYKVSFRLPDLPGDALLAALITAKNNGSCIDMIFLDGVVAPASNTITNQGPRADWTVAKLDRSENSDEAAMYDVELVPGQTANVPAWASYTGS